MHVVLETNDVVFLSLAQAVLKDAAIDCVVLDQEMAMLHGGIDAIRMRLCVADTQANRAQELIDALEKSPWDGEPPE